MRNILVMLSQHAIKYHQMKHLYSVTQQHMFPSFFSNCVCMCEEVEKGGLDVAINVISFAE